jgi:hypothetical protein
MNKGLSPQIGSIIFAAILIGIVSIPFLSPVQNQLKKMELRRQTIAAETERVEKANTFDLSGTVEKHLDSGFGTLHSFKLDIDGKKLLIEARGCLPKSFYTIAANEKQFRFQGTKVFGNFLATKITVCGYDFDFNTISQKSIKKKYWSLAKKNV